MKTSIFFIPQTCLILLAIFIQTVVSAQAVSLNLSTMTKYLDGTQISQDLSQRNDIAAIGIKDANSVYYFTSDASFEAWAKGQPGGIAAANRNKALANINAYATSHGYLDLEEGSTLPQDLENYINAQVPELAAAVGNPIIFGCTLYDDPIFQGSKKTCVGPFYLTLGSFNNRAESAKGIGYLTIVTFCDKKFFGGKKLTIFVPGVFSVVNFGELNNRIASYFTH